jgi:hypothetical protein
VSKDCTMVAVSEQMGRMQCILETDRNKILIKNLRTFALLAEGPAA